MCTLIYAGYDSTARYTYGATQTMLYGLKYNVDLGLIRGDATRRDAMRCDAMRRNAKRRYYIACNATTCIIVRTPIF